MELIFMKKSHFNSIKQEQGVIIVVALVVLLVMTLISVTLISGSTLQIKMAANARQATVAQLNAEAALRSAEADLTTADFNSEPDPLNAIELAFTGVSAAAGNFYVRENLETVGFDTTERSGWDAGNLGGEVNTFGTSRFIVEYLGQLKSGSPDQSINIGIENRQNISNDPHMFRITTIGYGDNTNLDSILQSTYSTATNQ
jgi:type IV pilus assembly protein PilX